MTVTVVVLTVLLAVALGGSRSRRLRRSPVRVRTGIHTGPAIEKGRDFFGRNNAPPPARAPRLDLP